MAWNNKGAALKTLGRHEEAIACFEKALAFDPQHAMAWHHKGVVLGRFGRHEEAMTCYDKALAIGPSFPLCWNNKGLLFYLLGQREQALTCYDKALEIDPRHTETWINRRKTLGVLRGCWCPFFFDLGPPGLLSSLHLGNGGSGSFALSAI